LTIIDAQHNITLPRRFGVVVLALLMALSAMTFVGLTGGATRAANFGTVKMQTAGTCTDANAETLNHGGTCTVAIGDNEQATPRHTPHLPCADIELVGIGMALPTGAYTIDSIAPTGSGQAYLSPASPATWHYDQVKGGEQVIDVVNVKTLVDNAIALGAEAHPVQGYHFKLEFTQSPQKHKTFWVNCNAPTPPVASTCIENNFSQLSPASGGSVQPGQGVSALYTDETGLNNTAPYTVVFTLTDAGGMVTNLVPNVQFQQGGYGIHGNTVATISAVVPANLVAGAYTVFLKAYDTDQNKGVGGQDCGVATWPVTVTTPPPAGASTLQAFVYLCDATGAQTTTPEPGAFTYVMAATTGTGASPLSVTVPAGTYHVAAVPGKGFELVACGSTAGVTSQDVVVPSGGIGTANFYVSAQAAPPVTCPAGDAAMTSHEFVIGGQHFPTLTGHVVPGQAVTANFTIAAGCSAEQVSLVSYQAPSGSFDSATADQETVFDAATGTFGAGDHTLIVTTPACFFQVDFVRGAVITKLGPAGSNNFYSAQGRLISADNGGTTNCTPVTPPPSEGTLAGRIFLCTDGAMTTTPEPGLIAFSGGTAGSGASPLTQKVAAGDYTVTATAGHNFHLVSCGSPAGVSSQALTVPPGGSATATFYEALVPGTLTGVIKDCAGNVLPGGTVTQSGTNVQAPASLVEAPGTYTVTATPPANDVMVSCSGAGGTVAPSGTSAVQNATVVPATTTTVVFFAQPVGTGVLGCTTACGAGAGTPPVSPGNPVSAPAPPIPGHGAQGVLGAATAQPNTGREEWVLRAITALLLVVIGGALAGGLRLSEDRRD